MRLIRIVYSALRTFDRAATVRELQRESGLERDEVHKGLRGLVRRDLLIKDVAPRQLGTYRLVAGAELPQDLRGRFERDDEYRAKLRHAHAAHRAARPPSSFINTGPGVGHGGTRPPPASVHYRAAAPMNTANASGALRVIVKGVLDIGAHTPGPSAPPCALAELWKER